MRITRWLLLVGWWFVWSATAQADVRISLGGESLTVRPGENFSVSVGLITDRQLFAVDCRFLVSAGEVFHVLGSGSWEPWIPSGNLDCLGWFLPNPAYFGPGETTVGSAEFAVAIGATPGTYILSPTNVRAYLARITPDYAPGSGDELLVQVVPEPNGPLLIAAGVLLCFRRRR